ncbi:hypothetical protein BH10CYA1_BH10CYA1_47520 [soil metagenome]
MFGAETSNNSITHLISRLEKTFMKLEETKEFLLKCTERSERIERACSNLFVFANGEEFREPIFLQALEELLREGHIVQVPTAGQSRTTVGYRRVTEEELSYFHHTVWPIAL